MPPELSLLSSPEPDKPLLLTAREAAKALRISERKLWQMTKDGKVRCIRLGRAVRYAWSDLLGLVDRLKSGSAPHDQADGDPGRRVG
jgi:excisionase family DNA binding protein